MRNKVLAFIIVGAVLLLIFLPSVVYIAIYLPYINRLAPFDTDFINEIHVAKNGREIVITDPNEIEILKTYFEGEYRCFNRAVGCFGVDEIDNYRRYGNPVHSSTSFRFEVVLIGESKTVKLFPADDCGYYTDGPLSFLRGHYYMLSGEVPDEFIKVIEDMYVFD